MSKTTAKIIADSISPSNCRLTTFELTFPRFILAEFNTHRMISRNAASSRAIPTSKMLKNTDFVPVFYENQSGMQSGKIIEECFQETRREYWSAAKLACSNVAQDLWDSGVHKSTANRLLEPFAHTTIIASATEWDNFFLLRANGMAQPEFQELAYLMLEEYNKSEPNSLSAEGWHLPLAPSWFKEEIRDINYDLQVATGRIARVSYLTHGNRGTTDENNADIALHNRLLSSGHWSCFEHCAQVQPDDKMYANFRGFKQYRSFVQTEKPVDSRILIKKWKG